MSRATPAPGRSSVVSATHPVSATNPGGYFEQSASPLTSLLFLTPLIIVYEVGTHWYASDPISHVEQRIIAFNLMQRFFTWFGATGPYMPAAAVVAILLACHVLKRERWSARTGVLIGMTFESLMYAIPLVTMGYLFQHYLLSHPAADNWRRLLVLSIGAGVYEEMVFRLVAFHLMHILFVDMLNLSKRISLPLMVLLSAVGFSMYHYWGAETFEWPSFTFRTLAGIYFGMIFLWRGFGLTAGSHAAYDIVIVLLRLAAQAQ